MLPFLFSLRRLLVRLGVAVLGLLGVAVVLRIAGIGLPLTRRTIDVLFPIFSSGVLLWVWVEALLAGVDPESPYYVPNAPPFRLTMFALAGLSALWQTLTTVQYVAGLAGDAWLRRKLDITFGGVGVAGALMLFDAWLARHDVHPLARWRRLLARSAGALALFIALPWEPRLPFTASHLKPWLYSILALAALLGFVRGWPMFSSSIAPARPAAPGGGRHA